MGQWKSKYPDNDAEILNDKSIPEADDKMIKLESMSTRALHARRQRF